ncbi:hypothetical protein FRC02_004005 [Tulasnella sp. 418]|nr:hypothetical protein FRC02_004005 [Tulasnella sp. 418]
MDGSASINLYQQQYDQQQYGHGTTSNPESPHPAYHSASHQAVQPIANASGPPGERPIDPIYPMPITLDVQRAASYPSDSTFSTRAPIPVVHQPSWRQQPLVPQSASQYNVQHNHTSQFSTYSGTSPRSVPSSAPGADNTFNNTINTVDAHLPTPRLSLPHENHTFVHVNHHHPTALSQQYIIHQRVGDSSRDHPTSPTSPLTEYSSAPVASPVQAYPEPIYLNDPGFYSGRSSGHLSPRDVTTQATNSQNTINDYGFTDLRSSPTYSEPPGRRASTYSSDESESSIETIASPPSRPKSTGKGKSSMACHACRRRKRRCDGMKPVCGSCRDDAKRKNPSCDDNEIRPCTWDAEVRRRGKGKKTQALLKKAEMEAEALGIESRSKGDGSVELHPITSQTSGEQAIHFGAGHAPNAPSYPYGVSGSAARLTVGPPLTARSVISVGARNAVRSDTSLCFASPGCDMTPAQVSQDRLISQTLAQVSLGDHVSLPHHPPGMHRPTVDSPSSRQGIEIHAPIPVVASRAPGYDNVSYHGQPITQAPAPSQGYITSSSNARSTSQPDVWLHPRERNDSFSGGASSLVHPPMSIITSSAPSLPSSSPPSSSSSSVTSDYVKGSPTGHWMGGMTHPNEPRRFVSSYLDEASEKQRGGEFLHSNDPSQAPGPYVATQPTGQVTPATMAAANMGVRLPERPVHARYESVDSLNQFHSQSGNFQHSVTPGVATHQVPVVHRPEPQAIQSSSRKISRAQDSALWGALGEDPVKYSQHWTPSPPESTEDDDSEPEP